MDPGDADDFLTLADWRRQITALYAEIRALAATDLAAALDHWRATRECLYRAHPQSPVPAANRAGFRALYFPHDPALRFEVPVERDRAAGPIANPSSGGALAFRRIGWVEVPFPAGTRRLALSWLAGYAGGLFLFGTLSLHQRNQLAGHERKGDK